MKTKTEKILNILRVLSWVSVIGSYLILVLIIIAILISFIWPEAKINLNGITANQAVFRLNHPWVYSIIFFFTLAWSVLNVMVWVRVKKILYEVNMKNPFSKDISKMLENISYLLFGVWLFSFSINGVTDFLSKRMEGVVKGFDTDLSFLFSAESFILFPKFLKEVLKFKKKTT